MQYTIDLDDKSNDDLQEITSMENEYYQITVNKQGSLDIYDKLADYHYQNQAVLVEMVMMVTASITRRHVRI